MSGLIDRLFGTSMPTQLTQGCNVLVSNVVASVVSDNAAGARTTFAQTVDLIKKEAAIVGIGEPNSCTAGDLNKLTAKHVEMAAAVIKSGGKGGLG